MGASIYLKLMRLLIMTMMLMMTMVIGNDTEGDQITTERLAQRGPQQQLMLIKRWRAVGGWLVVWSCSVCKRGLGGFVYHVSVGVCARTSRPDDGDNKIHDVQRYLLSMAVIHSIAIFGRCCCCAAASIYSWSHFDNPRTFSRSICGNRSPRFTSMHSCSARRQQTTSTTTTRHVAFPWCRWVRVITHW